MTIRIDSFRDLFNDYPGIDAITFTVLKDMEMVHVTLSRREFIANNTEERLNDLINTRMRNVQMYRGVKKTT